MPEINEDKTSEEIEHVTPDQETEAPQETRAISTVPVVPQLSVALGLLVFVFGITYIGASNSIKKEALVATPADSLAVEERVAQTPEVPLPISAFDDVRLKARSAIVWDVQSQRVLFNKNADDQLPLASITKLMTALIAYELLSPDEKITITTDSLKTEGDSGFTDGEEFTMQNLADITLISSSNDGANALSAIGGVTINDARNPEVAFVKAMNLKAEELGLTKTYFKNSTGLDVTKSEAGAYGSARDIALLMEYIITNITDAIALTNLEVTTINNEKGQFHIAKNTNEITTNIEGLIASKTGYTDLSGGNLVVAVNVGLNRPIIVAVLGSSQEGRFSDTLELVDRAKTSIEQGAE